MSILEKYKFLASILLEIKPYDAGTECVMISISKSEPNTFCSLLYQIINNYDETFTFQHLEKGSHVVLQKHTLTREDVESAFEKYVDKDAQLNSIILSWGPLCLFEYTF